MANNNRRRVHSSPGVYFSEAELTYSAKSLGITTLGIAGETLRGPAFQVVPIEDWRAYQTYFGGTSTEKYKGTQYPKYELPYIAKSYLEQSRQLEVVRVLGLSGVNAGPAWVITAYKKPDAKPCGSDDSGSDSSNDETTKYVVAVLRSRGAHMKSKFKASADPENGVCEDQYEFDGIEYFADEVDMEPSQTLTLGDSCNPGYSAETGCFNISTSDYGTFTLVVKKNGEEVNRFSVSLNPGAKNYIVSVLGTVAETGDAEIYVEEMYDVALKQLIEAGEVNVLSGKIDKYPLVYFVPSHKPVDDLLTMDYTNLTRRNIGMRYLYQATEWKANNDGKDAKGIIYNQETGEIDKDPEEGHIYTVSFITVDNRRKCVYVEATVKDKEGKSIAEVVENGIVDNNNEYTDCVKCKGDGLLYIMNDGIVPVTLDFNNYKEQYRYSSTPWVLSEMKGSAENVELNRLFRFHTISDGNTSSTEIKVSIANIDPENGTFDVYIRDFYDNDNAPVIYERYSKCTLVPGDKNYVALKIGSFDGTYSAVSKYVTVEVNENDNTRMSVPAGFLGYPVRDFKGGVGVGVDSSNFQVYMKFNQDVDEDVKPNRQYFGVSDRVGIDEDMFRYKGVTAYYGIPSSLTPCFHLDARILNGDPDPDGAICEYDAENKCAVSQIVTVDGVKGYSWVTVGRGNVTEMGIEPRIGTEDEMYGTIYENKAYRKFTMAFYGGWDGWDYYRTSRSNTDEFAYGKYKGNINYNSGYGTMFNVIQNPEEYELESTPKSLNSDYYAYLSAIRQLSNPKNVEINVLATPGIDYVNNLMLVEDVMEMVNDRADVLYVVTTPDKPSGAGDSVSEMFTPQDAVWNLEDSEIDTNRACTYYPWGKYFDSDNSQYVFLPITRDVVKSIAYTDNIAFPWYGNAGWDRGSVSCVAPRKKLKVGEQDTLYDGRINFVNSFAKEGDRIWGDKNLQVEDTQMNRISKRRLMLRIKKLCENACINMIFNPLDNSTEQTFKSAVKPILEKIKADRGIIDFRIEVDNSTEARERHELPAIIYVKPTPLLEYIDIKAVITAQGVSWS